MERLEKHQVLQCTVCQEMFESEDDMDTTDAWACPECGDMHNDEYDAVACCQDEETVEQYCKEHPIFGGD